MKPKKLNTTFIWKQFEDLLHPRLGFSITDRAVYSHLFRHTRLEGKLQLHFSMPWLARGVGLSAGPVRESVRRLVVIGALRVVHRSKAGHIIEASPMRFPPLVRADSPSTTPRMRPAPSIPLSTLRLTLLLISKSSTSSRPAPCASPSTSANADTVSIACAAPTLAPNASITSLPAPTTEAIPTATWFPAASNAIRSKANVPPPIFSAGSSATAASPPPRCTPVSALSTPSPPANSRLPSNTPTLPSTPFTLLVLSAFREGIREGSALPLTRSAPRAARAAPAATCRGTIPYSAAVSSFIARITNGRQIPGGPIPLSSFVTTPRSCPHS